MSILVVDDDRGIREMVSMMLENKYSVCQCDNVDDALGHWRINKPNLIITDIEMDQKTGFELIEHIRQYDVETPVVVMSGSLANCLAVADLQRLGANAVFKKPFSLFELLRSIEDLLVLKTQKVGSVVS